MAHTSFIFPEMCSTNSTPLGLIKSTISERCHNSGSLCREFCHDRLLQKVYRNMCRNTVEKKPSYFSLQQITATYCMHSTFSKQYRDSCVNQKYVLWQFYVKSEKKKPGVKTFFFTSSTLYTSHSSSHSHPPSTSSFGCNVGFHCSGKNVLTCCLFIDRKSTRLNSSHL